MANKRQRKKQVKKTQTELLQSKGLTQKEIKNLYPKERGRKAAAYKAADTRAALREERTQKFRDIGIPEFIIQRDKLYLKQNENLTPKQLAEIKRNALKETQLKKLGVKYTKTDLRLGWEKLAAKYPGLEYPEGHKPRKKKEPVNTSLKFQPNEYLYVGFAETVNGFYRENYSNITDERLVEHINDRLSECVSFPGGSGSMSGVFVVDYGDKGTMEEKAKAFYSRGYDRTAKDTKVDTKRYSKITVSNTWTERDFLEMVDTIIHNTSNELVLDTVSTLREYCDRNSLPFMRNINTSGVSSHKKPVKDRKPKKKKK